MERNGNQESDEEIVPQVAGETQAEAFVGFMPFLPTEPQDEALDLSLPSRQRSFLDDIEMAESNVLADSEAVLEPVSSVTVELALAEGEGGSDAEAMGAEAPEDETAEANLVPEPEALLAVAHRVANIQTRVVHHTLAVEEGEISVSDVVALAEAESEAEAMGAEATEEDYLDALTEAHQRLNLYDRARRCLLEAIVTGDVRGDLGAADHVDSRLSDKVTLELGIVRNTRIVHNIDSILAMRLSVVMLPF
jgi:hypothetical protein